MPFAFTTPKPEDIATICYTSGSTSEPKGCVLSHRNLLAAVAGSLNAGVDIMPTDVYMSYLPLAHGYERLVIEASLASGAAVGFYSGELVTLLDDMGKLRPTLFASVPRIFNKLCERILQSVQASGGFYQSLFDTAFSAKRGGLKKGNMENRSYVWDALVFSQVRTRLGGRVRVILSGSAPLQPEIHDFMKVTMSCPVIQGYGLTETCAAAHVQHVADQVRCFYFSAFPAHYDQIFWKDMLTFCFILCFDNLSIEIFNPNIRFKRENGQKREACWKCWSPYWCRRNEACFLP